MRKYLTSIAPEICERAKRTPPLRGSAHWVGLRPPCRAWAFSRFHRLAAGLGRCAPCRPLRVPPRCARPPCFQGTPSAQVLRRWSVPDSLPPIFLLAALSKNRGPLQRPRRLKPPLKPGWPCAGGGTGFAPTRTAAQLAALASGPPYRAAPPAGLHPAPGRQAPPTARRAPLTPLRSADRGACSRSAPLLRLVGRRAAPRSWSIRPGAAPANARPLSAAPGWRHPGWIMGQT